MKLVGSRTSPYVRKVRVILAEKNLPFEFAEENPWSAETKMAQFNPLVKVPALLLDDGRPIYDSAVIAEYLDSLPGGARFIPPDPRERALTRTEEALGDGICDAGILMRLERQREPARQDPGWIARQQSKVEAGIAAASRAVATHEPGTITLGDIALACALLWVDFRMPEMGWRKDAALRAWIERLESRASFANTKPG
jgi:glutathione S-transferase